MISVITINFNNLKGLKSTVNSVRDQTYRKIEHIIIDGGSTDGSKEYLMENFNYFKTVISELDDGIYNAMNKGIEYAEGEHVIFMNSGDIFYCNNTLSSVNLENYNNILVFGKASINHKYYYPKSFYKNWLRYNLPNHQTIFFPKIFYKKNLYNENFKVVGDSEYKFRALNCVDYKFVDIIICNFDASGISNDYTTFSKFILILKESYMASYKYRKIDYIILKFVTHSLKYIISKIRPCIF